MQAAQGKDAKDEGGREHSFPAGGRGCGQSDLESVVHFGVVPPNPVRPHATGVGSRSRKVTMVMTIVM